MKVFLLAWQKCKTNILVLQDMKKELLVQQPILNQARGQALQGHALCVGDHRVRRQGAARRCGLSVVSSMNLIADEGVDGPIEPAPVSAGVVLIRLQGLSAESKARLVTEAVQVHGTEMLGAFTVISPGMLRIRRRVAA
jgi:hypothetical protein